MESNKSRENDLEQSLIGELLKIKSLCDECIGEITADGLTPIVSNILAEEIPLKSEELFDKLIDWGDTPIICDLDTEIHDQQNHKTHKSNVSHLSEAIAGDGRLEKTPHNNQVHQIPPQAHTKINCKTDEVHFHDRLNRWDRVLRQTGDNKNF